MVVPGMDVSNDGVISILQEYFKSSWSEPIPIDLWIHNAGASGPPEQNAGDAAWLLDSQSMARISMDRMRFTFELNTLGPLRVTQALLPNLKKGSSCFCFGQYYYKGDYHSFFGWIHFQCFFGRPLQVSYFQSGGQYGRRQFCGRLKAAPCRSRMDSSWNGRYWHFECPSRCRCFRQRAS